MDTKLTFSVTHRVVVGELCVQLSDFDAQQGQLAARLVLVDAHLVLDVARAVRVPERVQRLHEVTVGRRRTGDHHRPAGGRGRAGGRWNSGTGGGRALEQGGRAGVRTTTGGRAGEVSRAFCAYLHLVRGTETYFDRFINAIAHRQNFISHHRKKSVATSAARPGDALRYTSIATSAARPGDTLRYTSIATSAARPGDALRYTSVATSAARPGDTLRYTSVATSAARPGDALRYTSVATSAARPGDALRYTSVATSAARPGDTLRYTSVATSAARPGDALRYTSVATSAARPGDALRYTSVATSAARPGDALRYTSIATSAARPGDALRYTSRTEIVPAFCVNDGGGGGGREREGWEDTCLFPPRLSCKRRVSFESRYGTWDPFLTLSPRADITLPNAN